MRSSKGSLLDPFIIAVGLIVLSIIVFLMYYISTEFKAKLVEKTDIDTKYIDPSLNALKMFDSAFVVVTFGTGAVAILSAFFIRSHPAFYVFAFILGIILAFISAQLTNIWNLFATHPMIAPTANLFPMMVRIIQNLPLIMVCISAVIAIVMHGKSSGVYFG